MMQPNSFKVLFIDSSHPLLKKMLEKAGFHCQYFPKLTKKQLLEIFGDFDGVIIRSKFALTREILERTKKLRFIGRIGSGMENIDVKYAESKGITCFSAPEGNRNAVGEHAAGMLLSLFNNLCRCNREVRTGKWLREENRGLEIEGKTIGIIGYGNTGSAFARCLQGFRCRVIAYDKYKTGYSDKYVEEKQMEDLFAMCDIVSLHIPFTGETRFMVNQEFLSRFKKNIFLLNTSRGKIVKTVDLVKNLKTGKVQGACLDVLEYEKTSFEELYAGKLPEEFRYLITADNVMLSPHIAGWTHESNIKLAKVLAQKIIDRFGSF